MRLAIMQPYFVPYIGYFQLMAAVDKIVLLDDVNFISRGWINRNRMLVNGEAAWLTLPLQGASQNRLINEIDVAPDNGWKQKMDRQLQASYAKAPFGQEMLALLRTWLEAATGSLSSFLAMHLAELARRLGSTTEIVPSSSVYPRDGLAGQARILDICKREGAAVYVNPPGGADLYDGALFRDNGVTLRFLAPSVDNGLAVERAPTGEPMSILHLMMHNDPDAVAKAARKFDLHDG